MHGGREHQPPAHHRRGQEEAEEEEEQHPGGADLQRPLHTHRGDPRGGQLRKGTFFFSRKIVCDNLDENRISQKFSLLRISFYFSKLISNDY